MSDRGSRTDGSEATDDNSTDRERVGDSRTDSTAGTDHERTIPPAKGHGQSLPRGTGIDRLAVQRRKQRERELGPMTVRRMEADGTLDPDPSGLRHEARELAANLNADGDGATEEQSPTIDRSAETATGDGESADSGAVELVSDVVRNPGSSLDPGVRGEMESKLGASLGNVQIHTGSNAAAAADAIDARAFTVGTHIGFDDGAYDPTSTAGRHDIAHELAHVQQQTGGGRIDRQLQENSRIEISDPADPAEREAEQFARDAVTPGEGAVQPTLTTSTAIHRLPDDREPEIDTATLQAAADRIAENADLSKSTVEAIINSAITSDDLSSLEEHVGSLANPSLLDELSEQRLRTVGDILIDHGGKGVDLLNDLESPEAFHNLSVDTIEDDVPDDIDERSKSALADAHGGNWTDGPGDVEAAVQHIQSLEDNDQVEGVGRLLDASGSGRSPPNGLAPVNYSTPGKGQYEGARYELSYFHDVANDPEALPEGDQLKLGVEMNDEQAAISDQDQKRVADKIPGYDKQAVEQDLSILQTNNVNAEFEGLQETASENDDIYHECKNYSEMEDARVEREVGQLKKKAAYMFTYQIQKGNDPGNITMKVVAPETAVSQFKSMFDPEWLTYETYAMK